eukprot:TRINITY_DN4524_c0_g1_i5.p1 TRINITY_DN4524_c0_g1~~TRINITY_DN4524_c0_g1_i5.p1  ORF type:complete len:809 (+),score=198.72 TRINITY_DN4524_c0_g1_i5:151-2577(+)
MGCQMNIPIMAVILTAMLLSTSSSLAGGLMIYFQGLESLERSLEQTSESEVRSLREGVLAVDQRFVEDLTLAKQFFYSQQQINTTDSEDWTRRMTSLFFAQVNASETMYYVAFMLHPYGPRDNITDMAYATVWVDVLKDGSRKFIQAVSGDFMKPSNMVNGNLLNNAHTIDQQTGNVKDFLYLWNSGIRGYEADRVTYTLDPRNGVTDVGNGFSTEHDIPDAHAARLAGPQLWHSPSRDFLYSYHKIDAIYVPPNSPHPWGKYRAVRITVGYLTQAFLDVFTQHSKVEGTVILLVNREMGRVLASTVPGFTVVPPECQDKGLLGQRAQDQGCFMNFTSHFGSTLRDAFVKSGQHPSGHFAREDLGGDEHFIRRSVVSDDKELIWLRPVSAVEGEVREALNLLILFVLLVLVFDTITSVAEVVFIANPLRKLAVAIGSIGNMDTEDANQSISMYRQRAVMVKEIRSLMEGMTATIGRLEEFRTFMPDMIVGGQVSEEDSESVSESRKSNRSAHSQSQSHRSSRSSMSRQSMTRGKEAAPETNLGLYISNKRYIGLVAINVVDWSSTVDNDASMIETHSGIVTQVMESVVVRNGTIDSFQGDRFIAAWNTVKRSGDIPTRSCQTAMALHATVMRVKLSTSVCHGKARVGNLGNETVRRFTVVTPLISWAMLLEQYNKDYGLTITTDELLTRAVKGIFRFRVVDGLVRPKTKDVVVIAEIIEQLDVRIAEWMYQLEASENEDQFAACNDFAVGVIHEEWDSITLPRKHDYPYFELFLRAYQHREFTPLSIFGQRPPDSRSMLPRSVPTMQK